MVKTLGISSLDALQPAREPAPTTAHAGPALLTDAELEMVAAAGGAAGINPSRALSDWQPPGATA
jgi:hypothetical protein